MKFQSDWQIEESFVATSVHRDYVEQPLSRKAFIALGVIFSLVAAAVFSRIFYLNVARGAFYDDRSFANANREVILPAPRGIILDRFGTPIVENKNSFSVYVDVNRLLKNREEFEMVFQALVKALGKPKEELLAGLAAADLLRQPIRKIADNINTATAIELRSLDLPEVQISDDYARKYRNSKAFAHVVGYGTETGLEGFYNDLLSGVPGRKIIRRDALGNPLDEQEVAAPVPGQELNTTIDAGLQEYFHERMSEGLSALGRTSGVGLALNPRNGEILALLSFPTFDPGNLADYLNAANQPLFNRAVSGEYNPGSTIKPLVALAALNAGIIYPTYEIYSDGALEVPNPYNPDKPSVFLDWRAHGWVDLYSAIARSSNIYFYEVGGGYNSPEHSMKGLGIRNLRRYWEMFRLGLPTGVDIFGEADGFLPDPDEKEERTGEPWRLGDTYNVSIGQGDLLVTPIQLLSFTASIGAGGKLYEPRLVISEAPTEPIFNYSDWTNELIAVQRGMKDAVRKPYGTANLLSTLPMPAAGKTGSAQIANNTRENAFFVGYMPDENPEIAVLVLVENSIEGSLNAVPIARDVLSWYYANRIAVPHE